ncbi:reverse transcriptase domain-containing protein [Tanacetum coccineum]
MISHEDYASKNTVSESMAYKEEITFPPVTRVRNAPVIIEATILERKVGRVYMGSGSTCEVIYEHCFEKLNPTIKATRVNTKTPLVGFSGKRSWSVTKVSLEITIGEHPLSRTETLNFVIVKSDSTHNMLLERTAMQKIGIVVLTIHGAVKFHTKKRVKTVLSVGEAGEETKKAKRTLTISKERIPSYIFAWTHADMIRILRTNMVDEKPSNTEHKLNEYSHIKPIKQNKRSLGPDRNTTACKEAEELTKAGILRKVKHQTWVANHVMVKKNDGEWSMCVDLTDINKACPKDCYPLPEIDWKIESLVGFRLKCFLDAYKGYHQIQMAEGDEDYNTPIFIYLSGRVLWGATTSEEGMLSDIQETFERFQSINMKLNLKKCSFGVEEGLFLGYLITKQGIKANPTKIKAITELEQPRALKDIQSLNGKLAALSRFLSKGAERSLPFFKVLKSCKGKKKIHWTDKADKAFKEIKNFVQALPTLTAPRAGVLQGAELNYPALEKLILALVHAARRLRRYFQAHTIMVPTDERETPADFLPEIPFDDSEKKVKEKEVSDPSNEWKLYTDGASSPDGAGAGLMLIDPAGKEYTYALRFEFETTNNEAEYEALLAGLRIAQEMEITKVAIFLDSQSSDIPRLATSGKPNKGNLRSKTVVNQKLLTEEDTKEDRKIRIQVPQYKLIQGNLYKRSFFTPWLRCIAPPHTDMIIKEIHKGSCRFNAEPRSMVVRITKQGYYWPSMHREAAKAIQDCNKCKEQSTIWKAGADGAIAVRSTWPFSHWGIHILGPLPMAPGGLQFLAIAVEHSIK